MFDFRKLFAREARADKGAAAHTGHDPDSDYHPCDRGAGEGLEVEYQSLIATQFRRWGISPECVTIEVRRLGKAADGFDVLVGMVRLSQWQRVSGLRVLLGLPLLEARVRRTVRSTWLADYSHFAGLWLHASERLQAGSAAAELRDLMMQLAPPTPVPAASGFDAAGPSTLGPGASQPSSAPSSRHGGEAAGETVSG